MTITFTVPGQPVGKGRPRAVRMGRGVRLYTPAATASYESRVAIAAEDAMRGMAMIDGPVVLRLSVGMQAPASWSQRKRTLAESGGLAPTTKPDIDNVVKAICDGLNGIVWRDDAQVVDLVVAKRYSAKPGVRVTIEEWQPSRQDEL